MSSSSTLARWAAVLAIPSLAVAVGAAPALASGNTYTVDLHQTTPVSATDPGVSHEGGCPAPADQDGWHFVLPTNEAAFVKLTVTFQPGGRQVVTTFGPPTDKHAYVASPAGAKLTSAVAQVKGGSVKFFNLSHTCPAKSTPTTPPTTKPPTTAPPTTAPPTSGTPTTAPPTGTPSTSASSSPSTSATATATQPATTGGSGGGGSLASTGGVAVGGLLATAAALVGGGMILRKRRGNRAS
ncbi:LPXTG cell wall anchor domain-containing protein [Embleya sp. MST-111070]|uniref:LPXTG cell wall anchor domain-containing protein n=1 Tax=Embleya sp. MST-111070 TaxID=3398231 RepID=UPI003F73B758